MIQTVTTHNLRAERASEVQRASTLDTFWRSGGDMHDDLARLEMGKLPGWNSSSNLADMISAGARGHTHTHTSVALE